MQPVTYRGGAPAAAAVASGEVPLGLTDTASVLPMIASGQVVALGVAEPVRSRAMPNIPTLREAGVPNFSAMSWLAMFAPRGTPDDSIARLNAEIAKIVAMPDAQKVLLAAGLEPAPNSPSEMRRIIEADYKKWGELIKALGTKARVIRNSGGVWLETCASNATWTLGAGHDGCNASQGYNAILPLPFKDHSVRSWRAKALVICNPFFADIGFGVELLQFDSVIAHRIPFVPYWMATLSSSGGQLRRAHVCR